MSRLASRVPDALGQPKCPILSSKAVDATKAENAFRQHIKATLNMHLKRVTKHQRELHRTRWSRKAIFASSFIPRPGQCDVYRLICIFVRDAHFFPERRKPHACLRCTWVKTIWMCGAESLKSELSHPGYCLIFGISLSWLSATRRCSCLRCHQVELPHLHCMTSRQDTRDRLSGPQWTLELGEATMAKAVDDL